MIGLGSDKKQQKRKIQQFHPLLCGAPLSTDLTTGSNSATPLLWLQWRGGWTRSCGRSSRPFGFHILKEAEGKEWDCVLPVPVHQRANKSYQEWIIRLPVRLGGFGFRSLEDMAGIAFIGALEQAVPALAGEDGICRQLEEVMGGQECFGEDAPADQRWRVMLASGCREGEELRRVWNNLQQEGWRLPSGWKKKSNPVFKWMHKELGAPRVMAAQEVN